MYVDSFFPSELITPAFALENALTQYDDAVITIFANQIVSIFKKNPTRITPSLLTWSLQVFPFAFIIKNEQISSIKAIQDETVEIYKEMLVKLPFTVTEEEHQRYVEIMLLQLSLFFSRIDLGEKVLKLAKFVQKNVIENNDCQRIRIIGAHLLFGAALSFIKSNLFPDYIKTALDSLQQIKGDSEEVYQQFNTHIEKLFGISEFYNALINKVSDVLKIYTSSMRSRSTQKDGKQKEIKQEFFYKYLYDIIDTKLEQSYKHQAFVEAMSVYVDLLQESRVCKKDFQNYSIDEFQEIFSNWFNEAYIFSFNPQSFFNFLAFGIEKNGEKSAKLKAAAEKAILKVLTDDREGDKYLGLPEITINFLIKNTKFLKSEEVSKKLLEYAENASEDPPVLDRNLPQLLTLIHAISELNKETYKERINKIYSKILKTLQSSHTFKQDTNRAGVVMMLTFMLLSEPSLFWETFSQFSSKQFFQNNEEMIFPYAAICAYIGGEQFRDTYKIPEQVWRGIKALSDDKKISEKDFHSLLVHVFALAMGTSFMEGTEDKVSIIKNLFTSRKEEESQKIFEIIDTVATCGCFSQNKVTKTSTESVDFATPNSIISAVGNEVIVRNPIGAIVMNVKHIPPKEEEDYELPIPEEEEKAEQKTEEEDELLREANNFISKSEFIPYKETNHNKYSDPIKLIKSSHLLNFQMKENVRHVVVQKPKIANLDSIDPVPQLELLISHLVDSQEYSQEKTKNFNTFMEFLKTAQLSPLCNFNFVEQSERKSLAGVHIIFNESNFLVRKEGKLMSEANIIILVTLISESDNLYTVELMKADQQVSFKEKMESKTSLPMLLPFFNGMKWLVNGKDMASIISIISYFFFSTEPDIFFKKYKDRVSQIAEIFQGSQTKIPTFPAFYEFH